MARKAEPGIRYYQMNTNHTLNSKIKLLFNEFQADGYWIWSCILDRIYGDKGYYFDVSIEDELELFATDVCKKKVSVVKEVINGCVRRGLFEKTVFDMFNILTSDRIQLNYLEATSERRRKGTVITFFEEFLLINHDESWKNVVVTWKNEIVPRNNPQSKVKESKVKESREEKPPAPDLSKSNLYRKPTIPTFEEVHRVFLSQGGTEEMAKKFFENNESTGWYYKSSPITNFTSQVPGFIKSWKENLEKNANSKTGKQANHGKAAGTISVMQSLAKDLEGFNPG